jgi:glutamyl-tRNA synthetase
MREAARREGRAKLYDGRWRDRDPSEAPPGVKPAIRLKAPLSGETVIDDRVQGRVVWQNENLDDLVLLRSDGTPTYMLAVVVDDHDMAVTHVIRGDDHLTNAARQKQIYDALGWTVPAMAHIPLIHGPDGSKLSKRHGALGVDAYRAMGYLPAALRNYLVRLGWSHGDQEIFSTEEMIAAFDLPQIGRSPARFDFAKLESLNGHYIRGSSDAALLHAIDQLLPHLANGDAIAAKMNPRLREQWLAAMPSLKERAKTLVDLIDRAHFLLADRPLPLDEKATALLTPEARALLHEEIEPELAAVEPWTAETTERAVRAFAERKGVKLGAVAQPLRAALTGRTTSPGIFEVLILFGKAESLARVADQSQARGGLAARQLIGADRQPTMGRVCDRFVTRRSGAAVDPGLFSCSAHSVALRQMAGSAVLAKLFGPWGACTALLRLSHIEVRSWTRKPAPTPRPAS